MSSIPLVSCPFTHGPQPRPWSTSDNLDRFYELLGQRLIDSIQRLMLHRRDIEPDMRSDASSDGSGDGSGDGSNGPSYSSGISDMPDLITPSDDEPLPTIPECDPAEWTVTDSDESDTDKEFVVTENKETK